MASSIAMLDAGELSALGAAFRRIAPGAVVHRFGSADELGEAVRDAMAWDLVIAPADRTDALTKARAADAAVPIVAVSDHGDVGLASRAAVAGASDFLVLGEPLDERVATLLTKLRPHLKLRGEHRAMRAALRDRDAWVLIGESPAMEHLRDRIARAARVPRPVLILGERGSGKELVARAIHEAGGAERPLVVVNCAAFPDALLESELFGHERGAYTGADRRMPGRFEQASGGTLFLDEIGTTSLAFQQKVLRAVEYGTFTRVGGTAEVHTTARIIAATNADLHQRMAAGTFLPDLYDRLAFDVIRVPPLRERASDIDGLARHLLDRFQDEIPGLDGRYLSPAAIDALRRYPFPGNVRELKNVIERAAYRDGGPEIGVADLGLEPVSSAKGLEARVDAFREGVLRDALAACDGNAAEAARQLDLSYDQIRHWVRKYGLAR